jgi:hypothetical protein
LYALRMTQFAALGKMPELRELHATQARARQAQGIRASLTVPIVGGEPRLNVGIAFETLADLQAFRERNLSDKQFQAFAAKASQLTAKPGVSELWEVLTPAGPGSDPSYLQRITYTAALGKARTLRETLEKRVSERQAEGVRCSFSEQMASDASRFAVINLFGSLADFEAHRNRLRADTTAAGFMDKVAALVAVSPSVELSEVIVPFQPVAAREMAGTATR